MIHGNVIEAMNKKETVDYLNLRIRLGNLLAEQSLETENLKNLYMDVTSCMSSLESAKEAVAECREDIRAFERTVERKYRDALPENLKAFYEEEGDDETDSD